MLAFITTAVLATAVAFGATSVVATSGTKGAVHYESRFLSKFSAAATPFVLQQLASAFDAEVKNVTFKSGDEGCSNFALMSQFTASTPRLQHLTIQPGSAGLAVTAEVDLAAAVAVQSHRRSAVCAFGFGSGCGLVKKSVCNHNGHCNSAASTTARYSVALTLPISGGSLLPATSVAHSHVVFNNSFGACTSFCSMFGSWCTSTVDAVMSKAAKTNRLYSGVCHAITQALLSRVPSSVTGLTSGHASTSGGGSSLIALTNGYRLGASSVSAKDFAPSWTRAGMTGAVDIFVELAPTGRSHASGTTNSTECTRHEPSMCTARLLAGTPPPSSIVGINVTSCARCTVAVPAAAESMGATSPSIVTVWAASTQVSSK